MEEKVAQVLSQLLEREIKVNDNVSIDTEENWNSLKHIEIVMTLEEEIDASFSPEDIPQLKSMEKIISKIKELTC